MGPDPAAAPPSPFFSPAILPATLVATCIPATLSLSSSRRSLVLDSHSLTRLDGSLVSLLSSSFPSPRRSAAGCYPIYDHHLLHFPFSFGVAIHPRVPIYLPTPEHSPYTLSLSLSLPFSKHYFSSATNAKLKRISPILSVNMPVQLPRVARSFSSAFAPASLATVLAHLLHVSPAVVYSTIFAILLTIIRIRRSANGYGEGGGGCRTAATGTTATGCFTFPR